MDARWIVTFIAAIAVVLGGVAILRAIRRAHRRAAARERQLAEEVAAAPDTAGHWLQALETEARRHRRRRRIGQVAIICYASFALLILGAYLVQSLASGDWSAHLDMLKFLGQFSGFTAFTGFMAISQIQRKGITALAGMDDVRAVGPLAEALSYQEQDVRALAEKALVELLPRVRASDADALDSTQRAALNKALRGKGQPLILAILKAYEQVGDESAIPIVTDLADSESAAAAVRDAARECLPYLHVSAERERMRQTLLRPSSPAGVTGDLLLRPAEGVPAVDPSMLLRAAPATAESPDHPTTLSPRQPIRDEQVAGIQE